MKDRTVIMKDEWESMIEFLSEHENCAMAQCAFEDVEHPDVVFFYGVRVKMQDEDLRGGDDD